MADARFDALAEAEAIGKRLLDAIHDGRATTRDLRTATAEARDVIRQVRAAAQEAIDTGITAEVDAGLARYEQALTEAIDSSTAAVLPAFREAVGPAPGRGTPVEGQGRAVAGRADRATRGRAPMTTPVEERRADVRRAEHQLEAVKSAAAVRIERAEHLLAEARARLAAAEARAR